METCMVLISIDYTNARKVCNNIENQKFDSRELARKTIREALNGGEGEIIITRLTDFMEYVNDQEIDNLGNYFISYVQINLELPN